MFNLIMLPYCILSKPNKKTLQKGSFFHFFNEKKPETETFEQIFLHNLQSEYLQKEEITKILNEYNKSISFPSNIQKQFMADCREVLYSFYGVKKGIIINKLKETKIFWEEYRNNSFYASLTLRWIKENKNPDFEKWLVKMLKIFILGMLPNIEKRKKGKELQTMIYTHFYDVYKYKHVYQDFIT